ncbi:malto-oligosyltrehalose trehalohydrolase [Devosia sp.]|uniref:malto-oligosyltrehalose trehalohydrolase n=1 Tax=Devosia sp. TaxID=1871048 RepID=UPI00262AB086|nr:malto-oligosyltrehalose trehalohydrolase [Devosia sp.]
MKFGTDMTREAVRFRLWAPDCDGVGLHLVDADERILPMLRLPRGWFELEVPGIQASQRYSFVLPDGTRVPDPASRFQPDDVDGPSEVIDPRSYDWQDAGWRGRPWEEAIIYEMHVGTFSPQGTFLGAIEKLDHLVDLGVTVIELMPIADFKGRWNWGYDGVLHFAPDSTYGRPENLKALIDAAHERSLMVILDVVYNHFGPDGNYMGLYAPLVTDKHETPWGEAVNYDDEGAAMIRDFVLANARFWLNEYHFDGLRLDAVQEIHDAGPKHLLQELAEQVRASTDGRHVHLAAENSDNQAGWLTRRMDFTPGLYTANWSDDVHHCLHCAATGESHWYYADFYGRLDLLGRALAEGYGYQGEHMANEDRCKGEPSANLPPTAFVTFIQNHDQIGNRPFGDRLASLAPPEALRSLAAINLLSPHAPLVFMGEEWGSTRPFLYFSDIADLADAIREAREKEFADSPDAGDGRELPDPMSEKTFEASRLDWEEKLDAGRADILGLYRKLIALRNKEIVPRLDGIGGNSGSYELLGEQGLRVSWIMGDRSVLTLVANLSPEPLDDIDVWAQRHLWLEGFASGNSLDAWSVVWSLDEQDCAQ